MFNKHFFHMVVVFLILIALGIVAVLATGYWDFEEFFGSNPSDGQGKDIIVEDQ